MNDPTGFETGDDEALESAVVDAGNALADAMGWHADRGDYQVARTVLRSGRDKIEAPLRAEIARLKEWGDAAGLRSIEARNPGIDMEEVKRQREQATLMAQIKALTNSLRAANGTTRTAQARADEAEAWAARVTLVVQDLADALLDAATRASEWEPGSPQANALADWENLSSLATTDAYKAARGVMPAPLGALSPEDVIRKIRGE